MSRISVEIEGLEELQRDLAQLGDDVAPQVREQMATVAADVANTVKDNIRDGSGNSLHSRTGQLRRSIRYGSSGSTLRSIRAEIYSDGSIASYAPVHELGATITAKRAYARLPGGPYLHIPVGANLTPAGVMRMNGREVFARGAYIAKNRSARSPYRVVLDGEVMFTLVKSVTIPERLGMIDAAEDSVPDLIRRVGDVVLQGLRQ